MLAPSPSDIIISAQTSTLVGAKIASDFLFAVHNRCPLWVISRQATATSIARYVYPDKKDAPAMVQANALYMGPQARLDAADIEGQVEWYKSQNLIDSSVSARQVVDLNFVK